MNKPIICAQMYTVREYCQTEKDYAESLMKVANIGYTHVQLSGGARLEARVMRDMLDTSGITAVNAHEPFARFRDDLDGLAADMAVIGCRYVGPGAMPSDYCQSYEKTGEFINIMNNAAAVLGKSGIGVTYHNHSYEFVRTNGRNVMDRLLSELDPSIQIMADVYWLQNAGLDPAAYLRRLKDRLDLIHLKDMAVIELNRTDTAEIGEGNMNMAGILAVCGDMKVKYLIIEQDNSRIDPFESLKISRTNLLRMLGGGREGIYT